MSAPHIILDNLPSLCQNCRIWWKFDNFACFFETRCTFRILPHYLPKWQTMTKKLSGLYKVYQSIIFSSMFAILQSDVITF